MRTCVSFGLLLALTSACSNDVFPDQSDSGEKGDAFVHGGGGDGGTEASVPPGCDAAKLPTDDGCVVNDAEGIFVSSSKGSATGDGSKEHPLASLESAITIAKTAGRRVYACAETYAEQVHLQDGVSVFGYFECASWTVTASHAKVAPSASPVASATNIAKATRVEAVDFVAPDFTDKSESSIALVVSASPALTITHATIHAGTGGKGQDGAAGLQLTDSGSAKDGADAWKVGVCTGQSCTFMLGAKTAQPVGGTNTCAGEAGHDPGPGGAGGSPGEFQSIYFNGYIWSAVNGQNTSAGLPSTPSTQTAQGGSVGVGGSSGASGASGKDGASGLAFGSVTTTGYTPSSGTAGLPGLPGQGGGGSGGYNGLTMDGFSPASYPSYYGWGEPGAAGGAGGCPGLPGQTGRGGGASIAIIAFGGAFTLDTVTIEASKGGDGGVSGAPSVPTLGGFGGHPALHSPGGGIGGTGGDAGVSGNGGGGPSIGIAYDKTKPTLLASKVTQGLGGAGVPVRTVNSQTIPASMSGLSAVDYQTGQ